MTRELDIKVAEAMGWHSLYVSKFNGETCGWPAGRTKSHEPVHAVPRYSTDYAALPEMLAWLQSHGYVEMESLRAEDPHSYWSARMWRSGEPVPDEDFGWWTGATLPEAVARLVVAVAEAQR